METPDIWSMSMRKRGQVGARLWRRSHDNMNYRRNVNE